MVRGESIIHSGEFKSAENLSEKMTKMTNPELTLHNAKSANPDQLLGWFEVRPTTIEVSLVDNHPWMIKYGQYTLHTTRGQDAIDFINAWAFDHGFDAPTIYRLSHRVDGIAYGEEVQA